MVTVFYSIADLYVACGRESINYARNTHQIEVKIHFYKNKKIQFVHASDDKCK